MISRDSVYTYPNYNIDDRIYFSDISISQEPIMQQYQNLISSGDYDSALDLLEDNNIDYYGADLLMMFENRLANIETKVWDFKSPNLQTYSNSEPDFTDLPDETGNSTSSNYYRQSEYFFKSNHLCRALIEIMPGDTFVLHTNYEEADSYTWIYSGTEPYSY